MIKSMTGYGAAKGASEKIEISVEVRSVNSRYLDCSVKVPRLYIMLEEPVKAIVGEFTSRGKVDVFITLDTSNSDDIDVKVNRPLAKAYMSAFNELSADFGLSESVGVVDLARFPEVLQIEKREVDSERLSADVCDVVRLALRGFNDMRVREGDKLQNDISVRLDEIERLVIAIEEISPRSVAEYTARLEARMQEILDTKDYDEQRIIMEAAIFADRVAISEELVRLKSHITQLREMLVCGDAVGRKIDFLVQEFNREANTIGSKGNDAEMAKLVVELKSEIEKIREQAQNIE